MTQRPDLASSDRELVHIEKADLGHGPAGDFLHHGKRVRPLHLKTVGSAVAFVDGRALVPDRRNVVIARRRVVLDPVDRWRAADQADLVLLQKEQDRVANDEAVLVAGNELFGLVDGEAPEAVDAEIGQQPDDIAAANVEIRHVVRLIEQRAGLAPGALLVAPVTELVSHDRE